MTFYLYEKLKFFVLIMLVILSLFQVGILWDYQNHGLPIPFFATVRMNENRDIQETLKEFFKPDKIVLSTGFDEPHQVLYAREALFSQLWGEARRYLRDIVIENKLVSKTNYTDQEWGDLAVKNAMLLHFPMTLDAQLVKLFLGVNHEEVMAFKGLKKVNISFEQQLNSEISVYITDGTHICKYTMKPHTKPIKTMDRPGLAENPVQKGAATAQLMMEIFPRKEKGPFNARPDIPLYMRGDRQERYETIQGSIPTWLMDTSGNLRNSSFVASTLLGNDKESYDAGIDNSGALVFSNVNSFYKIQPNAMLYYTYLGVQEDKGRVEIAQAFQKVMDFIDRKKNFIQLESLYLHAMTYDSKKESYVFKFNFMLDSVPVLFTNAQEGEWIPGITIEANNSRVLNGQILIREWQKTGLNQTYNLSFKDLSVGLFSKFQPGILKTMPIEDFFIGYAVDLRQASVQQEPSWILQTAEPKFYPFKLAQIRRD